MLRVSQRIIAYGLLLVAGVARAGVLPEERADALYHYYNGGGVEVDGPSVLVRKNIGKNKKGAAGKSMAIWIM